MKFALTLCASVLLLIVGCTDKPLAEKPQNNDVFAYGAEADFGTACVRLIRVRRCDYVLVRSGTFDGGNFMVHAADCENPAHSLNMKEEAD